MGLHSLGLLALLVASTVAPPSFAQSNLAGPKRHVQLDLLADKKELPPGGQITLGIRQTIEPGWHTYWINPGDSGEPTTVEWSLPAGFDAESLQWPVPHAVPTGPLVSYGYEGSVILLSKVKAPDTLPAGGVTLSGKVRYLVCKDICIPEEGDVSVTFGGDGSGKTPVGFSAIERTRRQLPVPLPGEARYSVQSPQHLKLAVSLPGFDLSRVKSARFFPFEWGHISNPPPQELKLAGDRLELQLVRGDTKTTPDELKGVLALTEEVNGVEQRQGFEFTAVLEGGADAKGTAPVKGASSDPGDPSTAAAAPGDGGASSAGGAGSGGGSASASIGGLSLFTAVAFAFLGGLILNLMPCVFPVLALKALSFANGRTGASHMQQGLAYFGGVLASFTVFAGAILFLRETGQALGWGFQFQSPEFVLGLAILFFALGLSLSGVFSFGGSLMGLGDGLTRKPGNSGYFFTGVLAAVAATPCTAPFMGAAIGFAVTQPASVLLAIFFALAAGFALPVVLLALSPAFQRILPKPGAWMETFKQVMAFPLYATAGWLVWVLSIQTGSEGVLAAVVAMTGVGFAAWLAGKTALSGAVVRTAAPVFAIAAVLFALTLTPNTDEVATATASTAAEQGAGPKSEPFTTARLDALLQEGRPVFVNFTAAWCITCKVNERVALNSEVISDAFTQGNIAYLKGDWTKQNPEITAVLQRFGRAGVPLYLFYPGKGEEPRVLPQFLTESIVLDGIKTLSASSEPSAKGA